jgi:hypothetical protein
MSYIYEAPCKARNFNVVYIGCLKTYVTNFSWEFPTPTYAKKFLSAWVEKWIGFEISTDVQVLVPVWVLHKKFQSADHLPQHIRWDVASWISWRVPADLVGSW